MFGRHAPARENALKLKGDSYPSMRPLADAGGVDIATQWAKRGEAHRFLVFDKASGAIQKANMRPPKSWKEFDLADRAARRAANLENAEVVQQTLIHINEAIEGYDSEVIEVGMSGENPDSCLTVNQPLPRATRESN
jgi:hypothetical protein